MFEFIKKMFGGGGANLITEKDDAPQDIKTNYAVLLALNKFVEAFKNIELKVEVTKGDNREYVKDHIVEKVLKRPSLDVPAGVFWEGIIREFYTNGTVLIKKEQGVSRDTLKLRGYTNRAFTLSEDINGEVVVNLYSKRITENEKENYILLNTYSPHQKIIGLGRGENKIESAKEMIITLNRISNWNKHLLANKGKRDGIFLFKKPLPPDIREKVKSLIDTSMSGPQTAGKTLILDGPYAEGAEFLSNQVDTFNLDWVEGMATLIKYITLLIGVPSMLTGDSNTTTYNNVAEAKKSLYTEAVIPFASYLCDFLNMLFSRELGANEKIVPKTDHIEVLKDNHIDLINTLSNCDFLTINEKRQKVGLDPLEEKGGDQILIGANKFTLADVIEGESEDETTPEDVKKFINEYKEE